MTTATPVLRFAMAHGLATMQRAIASSSEQQQHYDYIEAMACPSGCINGGGQVRMLSSRAGSSGGREPPRDTHARLAATRQHFVVATSTSPVARSNDGGPADMETSPFRKVPPLQLSMGAGKGVAVTDIQW
jgi:Iron only hydrogenase large subunit, C-terminal domain